jgi:hypothetical protein
MDDMIVDGKVFDKQLWGLTGVDGAFIDVNFIPCIPKQLTLENSNR